MIRSKLVAALLFLGFALSVPSSRADVASWQKYNDGGLEAVHKQDYAKAEQLFRNALKEAEVLGPQDLRVAKTLINLGDLCGTDQYPQAEELYKRALAIEEKNLPPDSPQLVPTLENLAATYSLQHKYADAEPLYKHLLIIKEKSLGPNDPDVVDTRKHYDYALLRTQLASNPLTHSFISMFPEEAVDGNLHLITDFPQLAMLLGLLAVLLIFVLPGTIIWIISRDAKPQRVGFYKRQVILGAVAFVITLPVSIFFYQEGVKSEHWPKVVGTITQAATVQHTFRRSQDLNLRYAYTVNGRTYEGDQFRIGGNNLAKSEIGIADDYSEGRIVTVSYDPARPETAVLVPGTNVQSWPMIILLFSIPYTLLSLFGFSLAGRRRAAGVRV